MGSLNGLMQKSGAAAGVAVERLPIAARIGLFGGLVGGLVGWLVGGWVAIPPQAGPLFPTVAELVGKPTSVQY